MDQSSSYRGNEEVKPGTPTSTYLARITEEDRAKAMAESYQKAMKAVHHRPDPRNFPRKHPTSEHFTPGKSSPIDIQRPVRPEQKSFSCNRTRRSPCMVVIHSSRGWASNR